MDEQLATEFYNDGLERFKAGDLDEALRLFKQATDTEPKHVNSHNAMGNVYLKKGQIDDAKRCWRTALRIDPDNVTARQCLSSAGKGNTQIKISTLILPGIVIALVLTALIITNLILLNRIGDLKDQLSKKTAEMAVSNTQNPQPEVQNTETIVSSETEQQDQAVEATNVQSQAIEESPPPITPPEKISTFSQLTQVYTQAQSDCNAGWYPQAIAGFQSILKSPSEHELLDNAQYWLGECYYAQKDYEKALVEFRKVRQNYPKANKVFDAELKAAYCYYNLGRFEEAKQKLAELAKYRLSQHYKSQMDSLTKKIQRKKAS